MAKLFGELIRGKLCLYTVGEEIWDMFTVAVA